MVTNAIYFIDGRVRANLRSGAGVQLSDPERMVTQCIDDAAHVGISRAELEENLGTDLIDFLSHELASVRINGADATASVAINCG